MVESRCGHAFPAPILDPSLLFTPTSHYLVYGETNMSIESISNMIIRTLVSDVTLGSLHYPRSLRCRPRIPILQLREKLGEKLIIEVGCRLDVGTLPFSHASFLTF